ncbi:MAG: hypothetical protein HFF01_02410 [Erysipelotrichaceae bacterium]|nr:hypothetical protein [Erysipelotrichaceae bacterium]MCI9523891.1 hypothetical protein [Erysipelotrichaceae bacterium]
MHSIIEDLYNGRINPADHVILKGRIFEKKQNLYYERYESLYESLNMENKVRLEELLDRRVELEDMYCLAYYKEGLKTGIQLMCEVSGACMDSSFAL